MKNKIYLAGSCSSEQRTIMCRIAKFLRNSNYEVFCPFELKIENAWDLSQEAWARRVFSSDVNEIDSCDIFLMITPGRNSTAGTNWEQGYAYAKGKRVVVIQISGGVTSLMTFCGANVFVNSDNQRLERDILTALNRTTDMPDFCATILT